MLEHTREAMPPLTIGRVTARLPIVQGGMAVRLSQARLAAAVARAGGIGIIAGSGMSVPELIAQIREARAGADGGVIGVNIMVAIREFKELAQAALAEGIDLLIAGAGFSRDVFAWCKEAKTAIVPIVGSARVAKLAERFGADAVVLEGVEAGGHLGTDRHAADLLPEILDAVDIPVIAAGGVVDGADVHRMLAAGAAGVQMGSRFLATQESDAPGAFKQMYVDATEDDVVTVLSPVGLPGRALRNPFSDRIRAEDFPPIESCQSCLKKCGKEYCIVDALIRAQEGDVETGLVFAGSCAARIHDIPPVADLMVRLEEEYEAAAGEAVA